MRDMYMRFLIVMVLLIAGCAGEPRETAAPATTAAPVVTTAAPATTAAPVVTTTAPVEEGVTIISFYDPVDDVYLDGKVYMDVVFIGNVVGGEIKIQHADIPEKEDTRLSEAKYIIEFETEIRGNPLKKKWTVTKTELFSPKLKLDVREKPIG